MSIIKIVSTIVIYINTTINSIINMTSKQTEIRQSNESFGDFMIGV